jgi:hypothetical protein
MKTILMLFSGLILMTHTALAEQVRTVQMLPAVAQVEFPGNYHGYEVRFVELKGGNFGVGVYAQWYEGSRNHGVVGAAFAPAQGVIKRVGDSLVWFVNGRQIQLAHTKWWYDTWLPEDSVALKAQSTPDHGNPSGFNVYNLSAQILLK